MTAAILSIAVVFFTYVVFKIDFTRLIFGKIGEPAEETNQVTQSKIEPTRVITKEPILSEIKPPSPQPESDVVGSIYRYTDKNGVLAMVDSLEKVPSRYRANMKVSGIPDNTKRTAVIVRNNQVFVPVCIGYRGKMVNVYLLLDTGATGVTISPAVAQHLGIMPEDTKQGVSILADGTTRPNASATAAFVSVGPKTKQNLELHIMPRAGGEETGLLGMSFLSEFSHMVDVKAGVIKWM